MDDISAILYAVDPDFTEDIISSVKHRMEGLPLAPEYIQIALYHTLNLPFDIRELSSMFVDCDCLAAYNKSLLSIMGVDCITMDENNMDDDTVYNTMDTIDGSAGDVGSDIASILAGLSI